MPYMGEWADLGAATQPSMAATKSCLLLSEQYFTLHGNCMIKERISEAEKKQGRQASFSNAFFFFFPFFFLRLIFPGSKKNA